MNTVSFMSDVLDSWRLSVRLLLPKNLKSFVLVTLKATGQVYKTLFLACWWLLIPFVCLVMYDIWVLPPHDWVLVGLQLFFVGALFSCIILAARPSVLKKEYAYFGQYWQKIVIMPFFFATIFLMHEVLWRPEGALGVIFSGLPLSIVLFLCKILFIFLLLLLIVPLYPTPTNFPFQVSPYLALFLMKFMTLIAGPFWVDVSLYFQFQSIALYFSPFIIFIALYTADIGIKKICTTLVYSAKMVLYNYPLLLIAAFVFKIIYFDIIFNLPLVIYGLIHFIKTGNFVLLPGDAIAAFWMKSRVLYNVQIFYGHLGPVCLMTLASPFAICFYTNLYTKNIHEYPARYIPK